MFLIELLINGLKWFWEEIIEDIFRAKKSKRKSDDPPAVM